MATWPATPELLMRRQEELGRSAAPPWELPGEGVAVGACFACFAPAGRGRPPGDAGERGWAGAAVIRQDGPPSTAVVTGEAAARYEPGLLALREGPLLESAVRALDGLPDVLLVSATGRDHPRRAGLTLHLGAELGIPTIGVTDRPLSATGPWPPDRRGASSPLEAGGELVGYWLRTRRGVRPVAVHAGWRTTPELAVELVLSTVTRARTPEPLRRARMLARRARGLATRTLTRRRVDAPR